MGMMGRWLVKETWKPVSGSPITVFSAATAANSMPEGGEWEVDSIAKRGHVKGRVIGFAQVQSNSYLGHHKSLGDLIDAVEDNGRVMYWEDGETPDEVEDDPEPSDDDEAAQDDDAEPEEDEKPDEALPGVDICVHCEQEIDEGWCPDCDGEKEDDESALSQIEEDAAEVEVMMENADIDEDDVIREPDPSGEPKTLTFAPDPEYEPDDDKLRRDGQVVAEPTDEKYGGDTVYKMKERAEDPDIMEDVVYRGIVNGVQHYGVFVSLTTPMGDTDVAGLVHKSKLPLARDPGYYRAGDTAYVTLIEQAEKGPRFNMVDDGVDR